MRSLIPYFPGNFKISENRLDMCKNSVLFPKILGIYKQTMYVPLEEYMSIPGIVSRTLNSIPAAC